MNYMNLKRRTLKTNLYKFHRFSDSIFYYQITIMDKMNKNCHSTFPFKFYPGMTSEGTHRHYGKPMFSIQNKTNIILEINSYSLLVFFLLFILSLQSH